MIRVEDFVCPHHGYKIFSFRQVDDVVCIARKHVNRLDSIPTHLEFKYLMLERIDIRPFLKEFGKEIDSVSCGGESGQEARICDYKWILDAHVQCVEFGVPFHYHQTGAKLLKNGKVYEIPREYQHEQARKAGLDYGGGLEIPECLHRGCE